MSAAVLLAACDQTPSAPPAQTAQRPAVSVVVVHARDVVRTAELPGRVSASQVSDVRPQINGIVQKRLFREGSDVKAGDALYQIVPDTYQAALDSAQATLQSALASVPSAQAKVDRYQELAKSNAVSKQDVDDAVAALAVAKAAVESGKAAVQTATINLDYTTVRAPIAGRVDASALTPGALVTASQDTALTTVRTLDPVNVDVIQSATNMLRFKEAIRTGRLKFNGPGVTVKLTLEDGSTYAHSGTIQFAENNIDETTGTFTLRASFPNPDHLLLPGMYVRAVLDEGVEPNTFVVTQQAVTRNAKGEATALVVGADGKVEQRVLEVLRNVGNGWQVGSGVKDGDRVIVEGVQLVRPGQEVKAQEVTVDDATGDVKDANAKAAAE
ncbi:efflux RND transporter periplasmic adaptor subunit [Methylopila sp. M107]|uniref:efflux RND transporter periplasmic adaptor subunit n=1 Tax=Methylopila sp. M107 TaxID=1101190 RepID=UPI0012DE84DE